MKRVSLCCALLALLTGCLSSNVPADRTQSPNPTGERTELDLRSLVSQGAPRWRTLAEAPVARQEVAAAVLKGKAYVAGGLTQSEGATTRVDVYDIAKDAWTQGPALPRRIHHAMAATFRDQVLVIGGFDENNVPSDRVYASRGGAWRLFGRLNRGRASGAAVVVGSGDAQRLFVVGGQSAGQLAAPVEEFDRTTARWIDRAPISTPRHHVAAVATPTHIYVSGGRRPNPGGGGDVNVAAFDRYNVAEDRWERLPNVPTARSGHGAGFVGGKVVVLGGEDPSIADSPSIADTEEYDIRRNIWGRTYPAMFRPRHGVAAITIGNDIYVFLGGSRAALAPTASSDVLLTP